VKKRHRTSVILGLISAAAVFGVSAGCGGADGATAEGNDNELPTVLVEVDAPIVEDAVRVLSLNGEIRADRHVTLISQVSGRLISRPVEMGDEVSKGQVIAIVDYAQLDLSVRQARAAFSSAEEQSANLTSELERLERLYAAGGASQQQLDQVRTQERAAREGVNQARAALEQAQIMRREAEIRAPFSGMIGPVMVNVGDMIAPQVPIAVVVDTENLIGAVRVPERDLGLVSVGQPVTVKVAAFPDREFAGEVLRISPIIDAATRMVDVEVKIHNRDKLLKSGMFATLNIEIGRHPNTMMVPSNAVLRESRIAALSTGSDFERVYYVYVVEDGHAVRRNVEIGYTTGENIEIVSGITPNDTLVTTGHHLLQDGQPVSIVSTEANGGTAS
jgi:RND family efflux transporter MFP subunit